MHKIFVLLSGGVDSTTTLAMAADEFPNDPIECVSIDYGQRHRKEMECAAKQAASFSATYAIVPAQGFMSGLLIDAGDANKPIPEVSYAELPEGISPSYIAFRNGLMLSILTARAQGWVMEQQEKGIDAKATLYCGIHADDAANDAYADCTLEFAGAMANAIYVGTYFKVRLRVPLVHMAKPDVVSKGAELGVDYSNTWSCYVGADVHCGVCPTCRARKEAFELGGVPDPTTYAE